MRLPWHADKATWKREAEEDRQLDQLAVADVGVVCILG